MSALSEADQCHRTSFNALPSRSSAIPGTNTIILRVLFTYIEQAGQLAHYGWNKRIQVRTARDRKIISIAYWMCVSCRYDIVSLFLTCSSSRPSQTRTEPGGELVISIVSASSIPGTKPYRTATDRVCMQLQGMAKLKGRVPSDEVEELAFRVQWIPKQATGGAALSTKDTSSEGLAVVCNVLVRFFCVDFFIYVLHC